MCTCNECNYTNSNSYCNIFDEQFTVDQLYCPFYKKTIIKWGGGCLSMTKNLKKSINTKFGKEICLG